MQPAACCSSHKSQSLTVIAGIGQYQGIFITMTSEQQRGGIVLTILYVEAPLSGPLTPTPSSNYSAVASVSHQLLSFVIILKMQTNFVACVYVDSHNF